MDLFEHVGDGSNLLASEQRLFCMGSGVKQALLTLSISQTLESVGGPSGGVCALSTRIPTRRVELAWW